MPTILQINSTANWGSTGRIAEQINNLACSKGWDCYIAYGRYKNLSSSKLIKVGKSFDVYFHYFINRVFDNEGLGSRCATKRLIRQIKEINPDIIHLHNIHDHWLNYQLLFEFLNSIDTPIVWTQHDCWAFTGGCPHYSLNNCQKWQVECKDCSFRKNLVDHSQQQFNLRKKLFLANRNLTIVPVSSWLADEVRKSFLNVLNIKPIFNGVDVDLFKPQNNTNLVGKYGLENKYILLALATSWSKSKGFDDYIALSKIIPEDCVLVLVGVSPKIKESLPPNILGIPRTHDLLELVELYSMADIVLNLSYQETFGLTTVEGMACGTPSIVYNSTASPELITPDTGVVVQSGDVDGVLKAINYIRNLGKEYFFNSCRRRAVEVYNKNLCYENYVQLYEQLLASK